MIRYLVFVLSLCVVTRTSPIPEPVHGDQRSLAAQQFLVLHPQLVGPQLGALKYEQPIIAPITQLGHISTPKEQLYFFYPSSPLSQAPVVTFQRDDGADFNLISFISNWFASKPAETAAPAATPAEAVQPAEAPIPAAAPPSPAQELPATETSVGEELRPGLFPVGFSEQKPGTLELSDPDAELIPQNPPARPPQPAFAPFPLVPHIPDRRVYILSGQPQFYGNFDAFANPLNPIFSLQPLSAIIPRSKDDSQMVAAEESVSNSIVPVEEIVAPPAADLKTTSLEVVPEEKLLPVLEVDAPVDVIARSNSRSEPILTELEAMEKLQEADEAAKVPEKEDEKRITESIQGKSTGEERNYNEPSVAQAGPSGLAIAGPGGVASSQPTATAVSGNGGISLASPKATSIAGDFFDFDEKKKH